MQYFTKKRQWLYSGRYSVIHLLTTGEISHWMCSLEGLFLLLRNEMKIQYISVPQRYLLLSILKDGARCERSVSVFGCFTSKSELLFLSGK